MLQIRDYRPQDRDAVLSLNRRAFKPLPTDPDDIPEIDDLRTIRSSYVDAGGDFLVGIIPFDVSISVSTDQLPQTDDGYLVAMGGYLPSSHGHDDERTVAGAAELHRMRVAPSVQGRGFGRKLLATLESRITDAGFSPVLATTAQRQQRAVSFYTAAGYDQVDRSTTGGYTLVHFRKEL